MNDNIKRKPSVELLKKVYSDELVMKNNAGQKISVPKDGSLGLLAFGYRGLIAWRKAKGVRFNINQYEKEEEDGKEKK
ncbi:MAG: hypothetical protein JXL97_06615 [Bacteroidales bacterium]|nr:hypothetical protein [Bacteroidales bacterium]